MVTDKAAVQADSRELATLAARIASEKQADAILVLDVRELITITDYFVIASGTSGKVTVKPPSGCASNSKGYA